MTEPGDDKLSDHDYDGIKEYDNPLPRWWVNIFWITIFFSAFYMVFYHFGPGPTEISEWQEGMREIQGLQMKELEKLGPITDETIVKLAADRDTMANIQPLYVAKCSPCHGNAGEGNIGPNLTDDYWIHGGHPTEVRRTISEGVPSKGMLTWKDQMGPFEIMALAAYVGTLQGSSPPKAKAAEGKKFDPSVPSTALPPPPGTKPAPAGPAPKVEPVKPFVVAAPAVVTPGR